MTGGGLQGTTRSSLRGCTTYLGSPEYPNENENNCIIFHGAAIDGPNEALNDAAHNFLLDA
jgi:hypothetical protein